MSNSSDKREVQLSKLLSLVLRHQPETVGLKLDEFGWADVDELIEEINAHGNFIDRNLLDKIVETNSKKRFAFNENLDKIRASQGHSIEVDLQFEKTEPPEILYHGSGVKFLESILVNGLEKRQRQHVHLGRDINTAIEVGKRHGKPVVFEVKAGKMHNEGFDFFLSANNVWLTDGVPKEFLSVIES